MALNWSILRGLELVAVSGEGDVTRADIETYLAATIDGAAKPFAKLIDLTACTLALDHDDLETVADRLVRYGRTGLAGPVAMIVRSPLTLDMAMLLKQRVGGRPFRIFTTGREALAWLMGDTADMPHALARGSSALRAPPPHHLPTPLRR